MEFWTCYIYFILFFRGEMSMRCNQPSIVASLSTSSSSISTMLACLLLTLAGVDASSTKKKKKKVVTKFSIKYIFSISAAQRRAICKSCQTFNNLLASATILSPLLLLLSTISSPSSNWQEVTLCSIQKSKMKLIRPNQLTPPAASDHFYNINCLHFFLTPP